MINYMTLLLFEDPTNKRNKPKTPLEYNYKIWKYCNVADFLGVEIGGYNLNKASYAGLFQCYRSRPVELGHPVKVEYNTM